MRIMGMRSYRDLLVNDLYFTARRIPFAILFVFFSAALLHFWQGGSFLETVTWFIEPIKFAPLGMNLPVFVWIVVGFLADSSIRSAIMYFQDRDPDCAKTQDAIKQRRVNKAKAQQEQALWPKVVDASEQQSCQDFEDNLCLINRFRAVKENLVDRWGVCVAPALLFGEFGKAIGNGWEALTTSERSYVADLVEKAVTQGSVPLKSMIQQGVLSGLAGELASHPERLEAVASILGQTSRAYVQSQAWLLRQQRT